MWSLRSTPPSATERLEASFNAAKVRAMMESSNASTRLRKHAPSPGTPAWRDYLRDLELVDAQRAVDDAALERAHQLAIGLIDRGFDPAAMIALLDSRSLYYLEDRLPDVWARLPRGVPAWAWHVEVCHLSVDTPALHSWLSKQFYYHRAAFDAAFPSPRPQHGANMSDRITVIPSELCEAYDPTVEIPGDQEQVADLRREAEVSNYPRVVLTSWARGHEAPSFAACDRWNEPVTVSMLA